jgi:hypothetical protein
MRFWHAALAAEPTRLAAYAATLGVSPALSHQQGTVTRTLDGDPDPLQSGATFTLICRRRRLGHNSWLHGAVHDGNTECVAWFAPADLCALGVPIGGALLLHTTSATLRVSAVPMSGVPPKTVVVPHGVPGMNVNALLPTGMEMLEPISGQHFMTGIAVRVTVVCQQTV